MFFSIVHRFTCNQYLIRNCLLIAYYTQRAKNEIELRGQGIPFEEPRPSDIELIKDTKELLESTNAKLLSDLTLVDREIAEYEGKKC